MNLKQGKSKTELLSHHGLGDIYFDHNTHQRCFIATQDLTEGQVLYQFSPKQVQSQPTYLTVQTGENRHIILDPEFLASINHSCNPNVFFDVDLWVLKAIQDIKAGEQMTYFYPSTEWHMIQPFDCRCGSSNCLVYIQGADSINPEVMSHYQTSSFIQHQLKGIPTLI